MALTDYYTAFTLAKRTPASGFTEATWAAATSYTGFIQPVSGSDVFRQGKDGEAATHRLYCDVSVPAVKGDKITQGGVDYYAVFTSQVAGISGVDHHKEILLSRFE